MIIVSQNREQIVNYSNLSFIGLLNENKNQIIARDIGRNEFYIGLYETEERAKEVLNQIIIAYCNNEMINIPKIEVNQKLSSAELIRNICYHMPEK